MKKLALISWLLTTAFSAYADWQIAPDRRTPLYVRPQPQPPITSFPFIIESADQRYQGGTSSKDGKPAFGGGWTYVIDHWARPYSQIWYYRNREWVFGENIRRQGE